MDISLALLNLNDYTMRRMFHVPHDTTQLLTYVSRRFVCRLWRRIVSQKFKMENPCLNTQGRNVLRRRIRGGYTFDRLQTEIRRNQRRFEHLRASSFSRYYGSHDRPQYRHEPRRRKLVSIRRIIEEKEKAKVTQGILSCISIGRLL